MIRHSLHSLGRVHPAPLAESIKRFPRLGGTMSRRKPWQGKAAVVAWWPSGVAGL